MEPWEIYLVVIKCKDKEKMKQRFDQKKVAKDYLTKCLTTPPAPAGTKEKAPGEEFFKSMYWEASRRVVLQRDRNKCQRCGATEDLEVHHIIYRSNGGSNNPLNLITLCRKCHDDVHSKDKHAMELRKRCRKE